MATSVRSSFLRRDAYDVTKQFESFVTMLRDNLPKHDSIEQAAHAVRTHMMNFTGPFSAELEQDFAAALASVQASFQNVEILRRNSLVNPRRIWYRGPGPKDRHWPALSAYLTDVKGWKDSVESLDDSSSEVVSLLANPTEDKFRCRGLVVGYVQSGKTANMTAVIAKAVDAGYNLIILLGGVTNKLRAQTQRRIENDVVNRHRHLWHAYTDDTDDGDFVRPKNGQFTMPLEGGAQLAVIKKESRRLDRLLTTAKATSRQTLHRLRVLIIDDECDQASVNSSADEEEMTKINEAIRRIIHAFPAVSYVGYTATPFANVFINPFPVRKDELDDLYPEDFITALPRPDGYFGTREVFGPSDISADDEHDGDYGKSMLRPIPPKEVAKLTPNGKNQFKTFVPTMSEQLERALAWYLITCAIRRSRNQVSHMTMLIHTSSFVAQHDHMATLVNAWLKGNGPDIRKLSGRMGVLFEDVFSSETRRVPLEHALPTGNFSADLSSHLGDVLDALEVAVENGYSDERLDFTKDHKTYIVIGGSVLARGLTLEGLCVSFFLRTSRQYDTLLQMGRWFGFRHGYEDLPRLWTTSDLISNFRSLAQVEEEIRKEIAVYKTAEVKPTEFAVKVRQIPGLAITSAAKMRHAYKTSISFDGRHLQTIRFDHKKETNWAATETFVGSLIDELKDNTHPNVFFGVPAGMVRRFLVDYSICDKHLDLNKSMLLGYLDENMTKLPAWNVAVMSNSSKGAARTALGKFGSVSLFTRSRLDEPTDYADIKALMSKGDILVDVLKEDRAPLGSWEELKAQRSQVPLLLIYPIDKDSAPNPKSPNRAALDATGHLIGLGWVFPGAKDRAGAYYSVELNVPTPEQLDEGDDVFAEAADEA
ncbi:endonuclease [Stenotrophomonas rhizophila]|nr:endonuclease [Stenotrophomonas rhizophila]